MADAGSRAWAPSHSLFLTWTNLSSDWTQVPLDHPYNNYSELWERRSWIMSLLTLPLPNTERTGDKDNDSSLTLSVFAITCWQYGWNRKGNKFRTVQLKVSSIRWFHRRFLQFESSLPPDFDVLMRGSQRTSESIRKKHPVTPTFLRLMCHHLNSFQSWRRLLWGFVLLAYFVLLRRSEYLCKSSLWYPYCIKTINSYVSDEHGQNVIPDCNIRTNSFDLNYANYRNPVLCPMKTLCTYYKLAERSDYCQASIIVLIFTEQK
ncbi:hypothetical protein PHMEG_0006113 [Phytophthora megakarya]|uniref:Uncharacterized protein n=1 Tax=Phytophthora megakarya TaxID=4795 RepID=A0A225WQV0_9STRA|nr:hypothetical protein PHMEG_0006113 [Phytophthora megakarya]